MNELKNNNNLNMHLRNDKWKQYIQKKGLVCNTFKPNILAHSLHIKYAKFEKHHFDKEESPLIFKIAGRMMLRRIMGKASFITLQDQSASIQVYIRKNNLSDGEYETFKNNWDLGDIVGIEGYIFKTNKGELSINAINIKLLTKSIRPLPDKFHGILNKEICYRQRYIDLLTNEDSRKKFHIRSKIISFIRKYFNDRLFLEVETPMMHVIPGGANAQPFVTFHNKLNMPLYLRISPELYLKRLVIGGFDRVYEINRNFRNEGLSTRHNPEFTMIEFYQAYATYKDLMKLTEDLLYKITKYLFNKDHIDYQGKSFNIKKSFERITMFDAILKFNKNVITKKILSDLYQSRLIAKKMNININDHDGLGKIQMKIFEKTVEHHLIDPIFITEYPAEVSPLARRKNNEPFLTDRFELFIAGSEIANGFSELNNAEDQLKSFEKQALAKTNGDNDAMFYDMDYIKALEYGLPPTAGEGIGIDRLVMLFTNSACIRDVILFPHMRSE